MRPIWHGPASCAARRGGNVGGGAPAFTAMAILDRPRSTSLPLATRPWSASLSRLPRAMMTTSASSCRASRLGIACGVSPIEGPCSATIWMPVSRSYFAASAWKAAVKPPDVTTCNSRTFAGFVSRASAGRQRHSAPAAMPAPARRGAASRFETLEIGLPSYLSSGRPARLRVLVVTVSCRGRGLSHRALRGTKPHMGRFDQMQ